MSLRGLVLALVSMVASASAGCIGDDAASGSDVAPASVPPPETGRIAVAAQGSLPWGMDLQGPLVTIYAMSDGNVHGLRVPGLTTGGTLTVTWDAGTELTRELHMALRNVDDEKFSVPADGASPLTLPVPAGWPAGPYEIVVEARSSGGPAAVRVQQDYALEGEILYVIAYDAFEDPASEPEQA